MFHEPKYQIIWLSKNVMHFKVCQVVLEVKNLVILFVLQQNCSNCNFELVTKAKA
jgi:hypothetical protein